MTSEPKEKNKGTRPQAQTDDAGSGSGRGRRTAIGADASEDWQSKLALMAAKQPKIIGSVIVDHDGQVLAAISPKHMDVAGVAALGKSIFARSKVATGQIGHKLRIVTARTLSGYAFIAEVGAGLLIVLTDDAAIDMLARDILSAADLA